MRRAAMVREACRIANSYSAAQTAVEKKGATVFSLLAGFSAGALLIGTIWGR